MEGRKQPNRKKKQNTEKSGGECGRVNEWKDKMKRGYNAADGKK